MSEGSARSRRTGCLAAARAVKAKLVLVDETGFTTIEGEDVGMNAAQLARLEAAGDK